MNHLIKKLMPALVAVVVLAGGATLAQSPEKCDGELEQCIKYIAEKLKASGWVGVELERREEDGDFEIVKVIPHSPAKKAGIRKGDILRAINDMSLCELQGKTLAEARLKWTPGVSLTYTIERGGEDRQIKITLEAMPAPVLARYIGEHILLHVTDERAEE